MFDFRGKRFGRLTAILPISRRLNGCVAWCCICDCGEYTIVGAGDLSGEYTKSCGCFQRDQASIANSNHPNRVLVVNIFKTGRPRWSSTPTYRTWKAMKDRCSNPARKSYKHYGGRGISVCGRWNKFENFLEDMGQRLLNTSIDRIDVNGNYEPGNCQWATSLQQSRNKRK